MPNIIVPTDIDETLKKLEKKGKIKDKYRFIWNAVREKIKEAER